MLRPLCHPCTPSTVFRNNFFYGSVIESKDTVYIYTVSHMSTLIILNACFRSSFAYCSSFVSLIHYHFRKDFRPSYGKLVTLGSIFPKVPLLGMTATATRRACREIIESLGMFNPVEVIGNPDRPNINFSASTRPDRGEDKCRTILEPKAGKGKFPFNSYFWKPGNSFFLLYFF